MTLESASITEMAVALGLDWVVIDAEHGHLDWGDILDHIRTTVRSDTVALVRIADLNIGLIKRALDVGADGVVVPWIESVEQLEQAVRFCHYPPEGLRGMGGERATCWGKCIVQHASEADEHVLVVPIIESVSGGRNIEQLCRVPGVELFQLGPADYSSTAGYPGQWEGPGVAGQLLAIKDTIRRHGKHCGVMATSPENLVERTSQGFRFLALGMDAGLLLGGVSARLAAIGKEATIDASFVPENKPVARPPAPAPRPPDAFRPDRQEVINPVPAAARVEIERGVIFRPLVGRHNQARGFTTGVVNFIPGGSLPYHRHPFMETVTVLTGRLAMEVEGYRYELGPLDNIVVPRLNPHQAQNLSKSQPASVHIAMASETPTRELVVSSFESRSVPETSAGRPGAERVNRHAHTQWYEAAPGARFQDFFNEDLGHGEMSGGYGLFQTGARLPCHIHDFDESISIIQGTAICVVEGREYSMSDSATALVPRGRCHYFRNDSGSPMAMVWVYAGPVPARMVMQETCCTIAGAPRW